MLPDGCGGRGSVVEECSTQEHRTPTKRKRNVYFSDTVYKSRSNDNNENARHFHTSVARKESDKRTCKNTNMVRKPHLYFFTFYMTC